MRWVEELIDRAAADGAFDDLPNAGVRLELEDTEPGWWARRRLRELNEADRRDETRVAVERALGRVWVLSTESEVRSQVERLNRMLSTTGPLGGELDPEEVVATWRRMARLRRI